MELKNLTNLQELNLFFYLIPLIIKEKEERFSILTLNTIGLFFEDTNKPNWENKIIIAYEDFIPKYTKEFWEKCDFAYEKYTENINGKLYHITSFTVPTKYKRDFENIKNKNFLNFSRDFINLFEDTWSDIPDILDDFSNARIGLTKKGKLKCFKKLNLNQVPTKEAALKYAAFLIFN